MAQEQAPKCGQGRHHVIERHSALCRGGHRGTASLLRVPGKVEQRAQYATRFLFLAVAAVFFHESPALPLSWLTTAQFNALLALYGIVHFGALVHAEFKEFSPLRYRLTMWLDIAWVSLCVVADPYVIPPTMLVYIVVVLGNGMRYGMTMLNESVVGCLVAALLGLWLRYQGPEIGLTVGALFAYVIAVIILIYAYLLIRRAETSRLELEVRSHSDALTGLMNRGALYDAAEILFRALDRGGHRIAVLFADLDKFKGVNDLFGHAVGDRVLTQFADIVREGLRGADLAARYGGDEFVIMLPDTSAKQAGEVAQRIRDRFGDWARQEGLPCNVTIGIGEAPIHGQQLDTVLEAVDRALYHSKTLVGGGGIQYAGDQYVGEQPLFAGTTS